ncbi:hypothetical protein BBJ28_00022046 [Nothophytophthora sp. Chile5]|nr:hypothetical protein BBJ28_00022046 [Nothophytophthora sp. Chile5]
MVLSESALISGTDTSQTSVALDATDPQYIVNAQFAAVPAIASDSSTSAVVTWLEQMDAIFTRVATGGLSSLPPNGFAAVETLETEIAGTASLISEELVLKKVLHVLPPLWKIGFWYKTVSDWKPLFGCIFSQAITAAKVATDNTCYDAAVNATSLMIRFTKDQVFLDGEDHGDSMPLQGQNKGYMAYLPELVAQVSKQEAFTLSEAQLRTYMATEMPSKTDGMDMAVAFPVYVDTAIYKDADAAALAKFLSVSSRA